MGRESLGWGRDVLSAPASGGVIDDSRCEGEGTSLNAPPSQYVLGPGIIPEVNGAQTGLFSERPTNQRVPRLALANEWALASEALLVEALIIIVLSIGTGTFYSLIALGNPGIVADFMSVGILTAALFCGIVRVMGGRNSLKSSNGFHRARDALIAWVATFFLLTSVFFTMKAGAEFSRGAVLSFFGLGLFVVTVARANVPVFLA